MKDITLEQAELLHKKGFTVQHDGDRGTTSVFDSTDKELSVKQVQELLNK